MAADRRMAIFASLIAAEIIPPDAELSSDQIDEFMQYLSNAGYRLKKLRPAEIEQMRNAWRK